MHLHLEKPPEMEMMFSMGHKPFLHLITILPTQMLVWFSSLSNAFPWGDNDGSFELVIHKLCVCLCVWAYTCGRNQTCLSHFESRAYNSYKNNRWKEMGGKSKDCEEETQHSSYGLHFISLSNTYIFVTYRICSDVRECWPRKISAKAFSVWSIRCCNHTSIFLL